MGQKKRYHPLIILFDFWSLIKNAFFFAFLLFVINYGSDATWVEYGRIIFYFAVALTIFSIIYKWATRKYLLDDVSFHMYRGLFNKSEKTIPYSKVHNIQHRTTLLHKIFGVTSITFETSMTDMDASIKFDVILHQEVNRIETMIKGDKPEKDIARNETNDLLPEGDVNSEKTASNRTIHFKPTRKDIFKASFTSLSFLLLIPMVISISSDIDQLFDVEVKTEEFYNSIMNSWWIVTVLIVVLILASVIFGVVQTFLRYGTYEISSDQESIYITRGVLDESTFLISKDKVQAIEIKQTAMKRMLGLAEVKLISAGSVGESEDKKNSLYPFLPVQRAYEMIAEVLPAYEVTQRMTPLPRKSLWVRLLRPSWLWIVSSVALYYFKPLVLGMEQAWWMISVSLFFIIYVFRILDFINTRFILNGRFVQFKTGSLQTSLFVSKREKVIEVKVSRNKLQKRLGLSSIKMVNRAKPIYHTGIDDVPEMLADSFYTWYVGRKNEIEVE